MKSILILATIGTVVFFRGSITSIVYRALFKSDLHLVNRKLGALSYKFRGNSYKVFIPIRAGPSRIERVMSGNVDVTDAVRVYLGPGDDFSNSRVTPELLGYAELEFYFLNGSQKRYDTDEWIRLDK